VAATFPAGFIFGTWDDLAIARLGAISDTAGQDLQQMKQDHERMQTNFDRKSQRGKKKHVSRIVCFFLF
jgi:hypothetical protein